uniref:Uncharacterized protein n=1 Tax=Parascaris equorum TaxID=6256 RepID=A0A914RXA4_PAREQ
MFHLGDPHEAFVESAETVHPISPAISCIINTGE